MKINPLLKFMSKVKSDDVMHSSGYAKTQNSAGFGASGGVSFEKRQEIEKNRQLVGGYDKSLLFNMRRPKVFGGVGSNSVCGAVDDGAKGGRVGFGRGRMDGAVVAKNEVGDRMKKAEFNGRAKQFGGGTGIAGRLKK